MNIGLDFDKLEPIVGIVSHRFFFTWEYNRHISFDPITAQRVHSWYELYTCLKSIGDARGI